MKPHFVQILLFASVFPAAEANITEVAPHSHGIVPVQVPAPEPPVDPTSVTPLASSTPTNCCIDGPCNCFKDEPE